MNDDLNLHLPKDAYGYSEKNYEDMLCSAKDSGVFDLDFYQAHCGEFETEMLAFKDAVRKTRFSNVNPSANFDTEGYMRMNLDVYQQNTSALAHYICHGEEDNRKTMPATHRWVPKSALVAKDTNTWQTQKVAIVVHIFYSEFIEKFAGSIAKFPIAVDVFVSASTNEIVELVKDKYQTIESIRQLKVVKAENRGRNFGPFLVEFSQELLEYDLMCHVHSKKSLYSGREQTQWFDYMHEYLLNDVHVVSCLLRLFDEHQDIGIYYPTSFWMMPSWVNHWTCNKSHAQTFVDEWGISTNTGFLNYPASGMFWLRPKAAEQWLGRAYNYKDFPKEPLPNDGSYLHALERSVGLLVEKNNYRQLFYHPSTAKFTLDKSYIYTNYHKPPIQLFNEVKNFEIVSFDIFDTILSREFQVSDLAKFKLGEVLSNCDVVSSPMQFVEVRNSVEHQLRVERKFCGDVSIVEIYQRISEEFQCENSQAQGWGELEFEFDRKSIRAKPEMVDLIYNLHELNRDIWFITDTYYTEDQIATLLQSIGISIPYKLFVSSELGLRKDAGTMWNHVSKAVQAQERSYIHIGDNVRSDAQICGDFGLTNMHVLHPVDKWQAKSLPNNCVCRDQLNITEVNKWGPLVSKFGRYPFFGE
ncbi:rhamnan synthesis F family protein [Agaribacter flavus]|uniref:Rhamnan synthesis F family protein n=1 Tax=Agaribacter flavus TaxID=1902781 RepID=A0ABV7FPB7_9ALTE